MSPRLRRLMRDYEKMKELCKRSKVISFECSGEPPEHYVFIYHIKGLKWNPLRNEPTVHQLHKISVYLHTEYPRTRPILQMCTPIFHPNIDSSGWICLGGWAPSEGLDELCLRLGEMIQYKNYDTQNRVNDEAALWAKHNKDKLPIDNTPLIS